MGRTGSGRDARQLVDRALVPAQRVRARAQHLRRRIPQGRARQRRTRIPACAIPTGRPTDHQLQDRSSNDELFEIARLVVAAEIAKIHTIEWTTQLLYDEPLYAGMNANWSGLFKDRRRRRQGDEARLRRDGADRRASSASSNNAKLAQPVLLGARGRPRHRRHGSDCAYPAGANDGVNHFGSPFNFPEEFMAVYRLHPLVPDMIEFRELSNPNAIAKRVPVIDTFRAQGDAANARGRACPTGRCRWGASGSACCCCAIIRSSCRTSTSVRASTPRSTCRRSTSSATANAACRASTSSAARSD